MNNKRKLTVALCLVLSTVLLFSLNSCVLSAAKAPNTEFTSDFNKALADFSFKLFKGVLTKDNENELVSPLSAISALAMLTNGADGNTKAQMEAAFGMDIDTLNKALYTYTSSLYSAKDCKLNLANSIWFREGSIEVDKNFLQTNADWYNAQVFASPFDDSTVKAINEWCAEHTDDMIKEMVKMIDPNIIMYLFNALVFDAKWAVEFDLSYDDKFNNYDESSSTIKMLSSTESTYIEGSGFKGFTKDYKDSKYSFVALLPDEGKDIYDFIDTLNGEGWLNIWNNRNTKSEVIVKMPEFKYELEMNLNDTLKGMCMVDMFSPDSANFYKLVR